MRTATAKKPMSKCEPYAVYALKGAKIADLVFNKLKIDGKAYTKKQKNTGYKRDGKDSLSRANISGWTQENYISENDGFRWQTDVLEAPNKTGMRHKERTLHPTQKPVSALRTLIRMLTNEGDLVLDCFAGSGSTGEACAWEKRDFILIEKSEEYYERDIKGRFARLEEELQQGEILPKKNNAAIAQARITHAQKEKAADAASAQTNLF
jgi:DNA modification methylase